MKRSLEELLLNPRPGSKVAIAKEFGIDLTLMLKNLRLAPDERIRNLQKSIISFERFAHDAEKWRKTKR